MQRDCQVRELSWVDEQEGCEWMNVSSGTGKTVVCMCVFFSPGISLDVL